MNLIRILRVAVAVAAVTLALAALIAKWPLFSADLARAGLPRTLVSTPFLIGGLVAGMMSWRQLMSGLGSRLDVRTAAKIYFIGQLGKYVPGSVWPVLAQMELGREHHIPRRRSIVAMLSAIALSLATALALAAFTVPLLSENTHHLWWLMIPVPFLVVMLHPRVLWGLFRRLPRLKLVEGQAAPSMSAMLKAAGWCLLGWLSYGLHVAVLASAFHAGNIGSLLTASVGGYALAWCAGLIVFLLPAGAGARDLALIAVLAPSVHTGPALAVAVISRTVSTVCDLGCAALAFAATRQSLAGLRNPRAAKLSSAEIAAKVSQAGLDEPAVRVAPRLPARL